MKYRVYNKLNRQQLYLFPTYFKTKREATEYGKIFGENAVIERKVGCNWVVC